MARHHFRGHAHGFPCVGCPTTPALSIDNRPMSDTPLTWYSNGRTHVGMVRKINEDNCLDRPNVGLWVVADGMGGHSAGDVASTMIVESLAKVTNHPTLSALAADVENRLIGANARLREFSAQRNNQTVGSTVVSLLIKGRHCVCIWAGDSRLYRFRDNTLERLSQDHALVEELVEKGALSREDASSHPQANLVTRAVGATDDLHLDYEIFEIAVDDIYILCSDGLDKEVSDQEIAEILGSERMAPIADALVDLTLSRGSRDNVTVVAVTICEPGDEPTDFGKLNDDDDEDTVPRDDE